MWDILAYTDTHTDNVWLMNPNNMSCYTAVTTDIIVAV